MDCSDHCIDAHVDVCQTTTLDPIFSRLSSFGSSSGRVLVEYMLETSNCYVLQPYDPMDPWEVLYQDQHPFSNSCFGCINRKTLMSSHDDSRQIIASQLSTLLADFSTPEYEPVVDHIIEFGRDVENEDQETTPISVRIRLFYVHILDERQWIELASTDAADCGMIPASEESIKELKMKKTTANHGCVICLEDVPTDTEVASMPCSHMFHQECIVNWLKNSHSCPICRFSLPTDNENDDDQLVLAD